MGEEGRKRREVEGGDKDEGGRERESGKWKREGKWSGVEWRKKGGRGRGEEGKANQHSLHNQ